MKFKKVRKQKLLFHKMITFLQKAHKNFKNPMKKQKLLFHKRVIFTICLSKAEERQRKMLWKLCKVNDSLQWMHDKSYKVIKQLEKLLWIHYEERPKNSLLGNHVRGVSTYNSTTVKWNFQNYEMVWFKLLLLY